MVFKNLDTYLEQFDQKEVIFIGPMFTEQALGEVQFFEGKVPLVFIDGGSQYFQGEGFCVGDGDSSVKEMHEKLSADKNFSDLAYALSMIPKKYQKLYAYGFLGGRKDHELINWGEFLYWSQKKEIAMVLDSEEKLIIYPPGKRARIIQGTFSLLCQQNTKIKISGNCRYPFSGESHYHFESRFLSNQGWGKVFIENSKSVVVIMLENTS